MKKLMIAVMRGSTPSIHYYVSFGCLIIIPKGKPQTSCHCFMMYSRLIQHIESINNFPDQHQVKIISMISSTLTVYTLTHLHDCYPLHSILSLFIVC